MCANAASSAASRPKIFAISNFRPKQQRKLEAPLVGTGCLLARLLVFGYQEVRFFAHIFATVFNFSGTKTTLSLVDRFPLTYIYKADVSIMVEHCVPRMQTKLTATPQKNEKKNVEFLALDDISGGSFVYLRVFNIQKPI